LAGREGRHNNRSQNPRVYGSQLGKRRTEEDIMDNERIKWLDDWMTGRFNGSIFKGARGDKVIARCSARR
jgi:hypothetical protein